MRWGAPRRARTRATFTRIVLIEDGEFRIEAYQFAMDLGIEIQSNATNCDNPVF
jgi:hypothetical protein